MINYLNIQSEVDQIRQLINISNKDYAMQIYHLYLKQPDLIEVQRISLVRHHLTVDLT
jgi:hypothetical protein